MWYSAGSCQTSKRKDLGDSKSFQADSSQSWGICYSKRAARDIHAVGKDRKGCSALCVLPVFHMHITRDSVCQPYEKLLVLLLTSNACTLPTVSLTPHSRRQQLPPSPLSLPFLSPSRMCQKEGTNDHLLSSIFHLSHSMFFPRLRQVLISRHYF